MSAGPTRAGLRALRMPAALVGGALLIGVLVAVALLSLVWTPEVPTRMRIPLKLRPPLAQGLFGTDHFGRDVLSLMMVGARNSLFVAILSVALGAAAGVALGALAAARGGLIEAVVMRVADAAFAFPAVISAIMLGALFGPGAATAITAIATFMTPVFARLTRGAAKQIWARDYVLAARAAGKGATAITLEHVIPNIAGGIVVMATIQLGLAILTEAGLSFLGLGAPPPAPSWGRMLAESQTYLGQAPWLAVLPGLAIALAVFGFNTLGDGLRDWLDPRHGAGA